MATAWHHRTAWHDPHRDARGDGGDRRRRARAGRGADRAGGRRGRPRRDRHARRHLRPRASSCSRARATTATTGATRPAGCDGAVCGSSRSTRTTCPATLPTADLVIDAAYGTGFRGSWRAPETDAPVLAVDIPSGVDGLTGAASERVLRAERTVTFAALKPGLLLPPGGELAGEIEVVDIGLDVSGPRRGWSTDDDVAAVLPHRPDDDAQVEGGGVDRRGLSRDDRRGAPLCARRAARGRGLRATRHPRRATTTHEAPEEVVGHPAAADGWATRGARRSRLGSARSSSDRVSAAPRRRSHEVVARGRVGADPARPRRRRPPRGGPGPDDRPRSRVAPRAHPPRRGVRGSRGAIRPRPIASRPRASLAAEPALRSSC